LAIVAVFKESQPFADHFAGRLVHARIDFVVDQPLQFGS